MRQEHYREQARRVQTVSPSAKRGRVKWFRPDKGYGFILPDDGTKELFFHYGAVLGREPVEDDRVLYVAGVNRGKRAAIEVKVVE